MARQERHKSKDDVPCTSGKEHEIITLLLEEYKSLGDGVRQQQVARMQTLTLFAASSAIIASAGPFSITSRIVFVVTILIIGWAFWRGSNRNTMRNATHIRHLEQRMNTLAARAYGATDGLFTWETTLHNKRESAGLWERLLTWIGGRIP